MSMIDRFIPSGVEKVVFVDSISDLDAPTEDELDAGTVLNNPGAPVADNLIDTSGLETQQQFLAVPDPATNMDLKITGRQTLPDAMLTFYDSPSASTMRTALAEGNEGFIVRMPYGQAVGNEADVYPVRCGAFNRSQLTPANEAAKFTIAIAIIDQVHKNAVIAA